MALVENSFAAGSGGDQRPSTEGRPGHQGQLDAASALAQETYARARAPAAHDWLTP